MVGSSPRMRGARYDTPGFIYCCRIIPADAGSTSHAAMALRLSQDHPRGCGEHSVFQMRGLPSLGSSPRMRGAPPAPVSRSEGIGIIPADAGSTPRSGLPKRGHRDHPRGCGEHLAVQRGQEHRRGSSPRMRGARLPPHLDALDGGIIPADAGSTRLDCHRYHAGGDHPRGCGEHAAGSRVIPGNEGSSPRMRGAPEARLPGGLRRGIIPADAGSTRLYEEQSDRLEDHPRGCGEHCSALALSSGDTGSSPRMRGARWP